MGCFPSTCGIYWDSATARSGELSFRYSSADAAQVPHTPAADAGLHGFSYYFDSLPTDMSRACYAFWPHDLRLGQGHSGLYSQKHAELHVTSSQMTYCGLTDSTQSFSLY